MWITHDAALCLVKEARVQEAKAAAANTGGTTPKYTVTVYARGTGEDGAPMPFKDVWLTPSYTNKRRSLTWRLGGLTLLRRHLVLEPGSPARLVREVGQDGRVRLVVEPRGKEEGGGREAKGKGKRPRERVEDSDTEDEDDGGGDGSSTSSGGSEPVSSSDDEEGSTSSGGDGGSGGSDWAPVGDDWQPAQGAKRAQAWQPQQSQPPLPQPQLPQQQQPPPMPKQPPRLQQQPDPHLPQEAPQPPPPPHQPQQLRLMGAPLLPRAPLHPQPQPQPRQCQDPQQHHPHQQQRQQQQQQPGSGARGGGGDGAGPSCAVRLEAGLAGVGPGAGEEGRQGKRRRLEVGTEHVEERLAAGRDGKVVDLRTYRLPYAFAQCIDGANFSNSCTETTCTARTSHLGCC